LMDQKDLLVNQDQMVSQVHKDNLALQPDQGDAMALQVPQVPQDIKDLLVIKDQKAHLALQVHKVTQHRQDPHHHVHRYAPTHVFVLAHHLVATEEDK
ncbi:hypothetical protein, partial [Salmonella sp. s54412]|uniref:hypothetical protein n=1 Tax=Salmonella sp. s54412 TaxID=3160128 RepID=UPI003754DBB6